MSIRTTVTLDDDVFARLKGASAHRGVPFREMLNEAVRSGLTALEVPPPMKRFVVRPFRLGASLIADLDDIGGVIDAVEGDTWR